MSTYKILNFIENTGQLTVEFAENMAPLSIDVPLKDGLYITGEELDTYIKGFIPTWHIERQSQISQGVANSDVLKSLVESSATSASTLTEQQEENINMWAELQFEKNIAKVLIKFGVLDSDPTAIPTQEL
jgi:hypothetical protein